MPVRRHPWLIGAAALVLLSFLLVRWAGTRPGYDPYGWLIWGYQTLHLNLDLAGAPSWKPLTWLFDVPFAVFGRTALWLWMTISVTIALAGVIFAGRLAYRLCRLLELGRRPALAGAIFAGAGLLGIQSYMHYVLSNQSDPMIVTMCLAAVDCYLCGRLRWALALGVLASLGRPEAWPFLVLYSIWVWRKVPSLRWLVAGALAVVPLLWFGVPMITNGQPLIAGQLAQNSPRELHQNRIVGTIHRFTALHYLVVELLALAAVVIAWMGRHRVLLILAGGAVSWVIVEVAFVLHGWPGVPRYLFEPAGVMVVLAGVAVAWILDVAPRLLRYRVPQWAGALLVGLIVLSLVPGALARLRTEHRDMRHERARAASINRLQVAVDSVGGGDLVRECGRPVTTVEYISILAWMTGLNDGILGHHPRLELRQHHPTVLFTPLHSGWSVLPWRLHRRHFRACSQLKKTVLFTRRHPGGVVTSYISAPIH